MEELFHIRESSWNLPKIAGVVPIRSPGVTDDACVFQSLTKHFSWLLAFRNECVLLGRATKRWQHLFENYLYFYFISTFFLNTTHTDLSRVIIGIYRSESPPPLQKKKKKINAVVAIDKNGDSKNVCFQWRLVLLFSQMFHHLWIM